MQCVSRDVKEDQPGFTQCPNQATARVWCPTWVNSQNGPIDLCEHHADNFRIEKNPNARFGQFFFGAEADQAFKGFELVLPKEDHRYGDVIRTIGNSSRTHVGGAEIDFTMMATLGNFSIYVVDGTAWLVRRSCVVRLGEWTAARERFPTLFKIR